MLLGRLYELSVAMETCESWATHSDVNGPHPLLRDLGCIYAQYPREWLPAYLSTTSRSFQMWLYGWMTSGTISWSFSCWDSQHGAGRLGPCGEEFHGSLARCKIAGGSCWVGFLPCSRQTCQSPGQLQVTLWIAYGLCTVVRSFTELILPSARSSIQVWSAREGQVILLIDLNWEWWKDASELWESWGGSRNSSKVSIDWWFETDACNSLP